MYSDKGVGGDEYGETVQEWKDSASSKMGWASGCGQGAWPRGNASAAHRSHRPAQAVLGDWDQRSGGLLPIVLWRTDGHGAQHSRPSCNSLPTILHKI